ncbi:putative DNA repair protein [Erythrobacter sp. NAP1]|uniref:JAB domain-containing protein n=1 Tax=Erythrobacter sp. NAP1 TaxID=237727 RepID=UPI000068789B|nr:JAB domain-containing protein [Erythrobacter sp. NAP1]EAQ28049.1 putative DNA repair protein [Erythrobacter sp. NAP1]
MIQQILRPLEQRRAAYPRQQRELVELLRAMVVGPSGTCERMHALFVDNTRSYLGDTPIGSGAAGSLSMRIRELFQAALSVDAHGIILAHNHPSGLCRPSAYDVEATRKLKAIAQTLDIELLDHLIFTTSAVYSMRAGGQL